MKPAVPVPVRAATLVWCVLAAAAAPLAAQQDDPLLTRAERTGFLETSRYDEVVALSRALAAADPRVHLGWLGYTLEGRALPLLVVGDVADASPEAVRASGHTRVYLQGNIHAGEVCGKEALLILVRQLVRGERSWPDSLVLLVAPIYNADGNERVLLTNRPRQNGPVGGMGQRPNAQGLDLNRDHTKLDSPEARSLVGLLNAYDPHVAVDLHTTNGTTHAYHLTYAPPLHPATPGAIDRMLREEWLPAVTEAIRERHGWEYYHYGNVYRPEGEDDEAWVTYDHRPRYNTNYVGVRNRFGILSEAFAYASFEERVLASLYFVDEILRFADAHAGRIRRATEEADRARVAGGPVPIAARPHASPEPVEILMGAVERDVHPFTGEPLYRRLDVVEPTSMRELIAFRGSEAVQAPAAYALLPGEDRAMASEAAEIRERLAVHGVRFHVLESPAPVRAERFRVDSSRVAERVYQGHRERTVWGAWEVGEATLPAGTAVVPVDQPLGRLAVLLLEPRADDGFVSWGFLGAWLGDEGAPRERYPLPILRLDVGPAAESSGDGG